MGLQDIHLSGLRLSFCFSRLAPLQLPLLGLAVFLGRGVGFLLCRVDSKQLQFGGINRIVMNSYLVLKGTRGLFRD